VRFADSVREKIIFSSGGVRDADLNRLVVVRTMVVGDGWCGGEDNDIGGWWW